MGAALFSPEELARLPLAAGSFSEIRTADQVYVDKTALVHQIAVSRAPHFLSRPKRFGKSLLVSTFETLFSKGRDAFGGLAIEKLWHEDQTYKVVHLDFSLYAGMSAEDFKLYLSRDLADLLSEFKTVSVLDELGRPAQPGALLNQICATGPVPVSSLVLLVDEYDAPITHHLNDQQRADILEVINGFFAAVANFPHFGNSRDSFKSLIP